MEVRPVRALVAKPADAARTPGPTGPVEELATGPMFLIASGLLQAQQEDRTRHGYPAWGHSPGNAGGSLRGGKQSKTFSIDVSPKTNLPLRRTFPQAAWQYGQVTADPEIPTSIKLVVLADGRRKLLIRPEASDEELEWAADWLNRQERPEKLEKAPESQCLTARDVGKSVPEDVTNSAGET